LDKILVLLVVLLFLVPPAVFGVADIENKDILAESKDGQIVLSLSFGDNLISKFNRVIPTLQSGLLVIGDTILEIENARTKIMGNSFVVHSEDILIYAKGLENDNFLINSYLVGSNQLDPIKLRTVTIQPDVPSGIEKNSKPIEMIVMVQQDTKTFWNDNYDIAIKVFDKATNPNPQFYQSLGAIDKAEIGVTLKDIDGEELTQLSGQTNSKGFWEGDYFVLQNLVSGGVYYVQVNVTYLESNNTQIFETFIFSDTRDAKSSG
jgi:hypothetical protein